MAKTATFDQSSARRIAKVVRSFEQNPPVTRRQDMRRRDHQYQPWYKFAWWPIQSGATGSMVTIGEGGVSFQTTDYVIYGGEDLVVLASSPNCYVYIEILRSNHSTHEFKQSSTLPVGDTGYHRIALHHWKFSTTTGAYYLHRYMQISDVVFDSARR